MHRSSKKILSEIRLSNRSWTSRISREEESTEIFDETCFFFFFSSLDEIDRRIGSVARISERNPVGRAKWVNKAILKPRGVYRGIPNVHSGADTLELRNYMDGHRHPTIRHTVSLSSAYLGRLHIFPSFLSLSLSLFTIFQREC